MTRRAREVLRRGRTAPEISSATWKKGKERRCHSCTNLKTRNRILIGRDMLKKTQITRLGEVITKLAERIATDILMEATADDYTEMLGPELADLDEAVEMLKMLKFPVPDLVIEVYRNYIEAFMDGAGE
jgi:hypothetical protein